MRKLNEAGQYYLVLKALQRASKTNLRIRNEGVVYEVMKGFHDKAESSGWEEEETRKVLNLRSRMSS